MVHDYFLAKYVSYPEAPGVYNQTYPLLCTMVWYYTMNIMYVNGKTHCILFWNETNPQVCILELSLPGQ